MNITQIYSKPNTSYSSRVFKVSIKDIPPLSVKRLCSNSSQHIQYFEHESKISLFLSQTILFDEKISNNEHNQVDITKKQEIIRSLAKNSLENSLVYNSTNSNYTNETTKANNAYILRTYIAFSREFTDQKCVHIVQNYCINGDLRTFLRNAVNQTTKANFIQQTFDSVRLIHKNRITHNDVQSCNIFIDESGNAFLGDFSNSKVHFQDEQFKIDVWYPFPMDLSRFYFGRSFEEEMVDDWMGVEMIVNEVCGDGGCGCGEAGDRVRGMVRAEIRGIQNVNL